jgi:hypothetical protein
MEEKNLGLIIAPEVAVAVRVPRRRTKEAALSGLKYGTPTARRPYLYHEVLPLHSRRKLFGVRITKCQSFRG